MIEKLRKPVSWIFGLAVIIALMTTTSLTDKIMPLLGHSLFFVGVLFIGIAVLGRTWCSLYISGYKNDVLVTDGPYSLTRNPLYFFSLVGAIGVGLTTETILFPAVITLAFAIYYPMVIMSEENRLKKMHGETFDEYALKVPRFFPSRRNFIEPEEYVVKPRIFRSHLRDALWFVLFIGFTEMMEVARALKILPTWFGTY
ncbi:MAG: isoprenylcysteine carboxylmethyltransferase family protein [Candidatus Wallbacteria bacterium HGW-Wallbacteria-1]|jgi:protein-S-isoprenylcysteine O-methyltransferase Ste14|uniref:Isoprenylcysteine carboxylmethyltransferase family protein n=1 Tax=Candidatus Wallbacteria bacterium HGW-Wallbacteria-1 TaxID=2013854 RepID=A0A2N1PIN9_9BACT|nr:MAG: isoprenylcysteine carboxylmethyltransferase family protein [Candidatus Wallbacteria bacterium HGW-Wallbacteria-1]